MVGLVRLIRFGGDVSGTANPIAHCSACAVRHESKVECHHNDPQNYDVGEIIVTAVCVQTYKWDAPTI